MSLSKGKNLPKMSLLKGKNQRKMSLLKGKSGEGGVYDISMCGSHELDSLMIYSYIVSALDYYLDGI